MPTNHDFKKLVRARMDEKGERYTTARAALSAPAPGVVDERTRSLLGQLADVRIAEAAYEHLTQLHPDERRAAAVAGLRNENWRVRRSSARLLDDVELTTATVAALTAALDDGNPQVRRAALHTLSCVHCKPDGCAVDLHGLFARMIRDPSRAVREPIVGYCSWASHDQWTVDLLTGVATTDPSGQLRAEALSALESIRYHWDRDEVRRRLPAALVAKTARHAGRWVAVRDGTIVAVKNGQSRIYGRELRAGAEPYWVAPLDVTRPTFR